MPIYDKLSTELAFADIVKQVLEGLTADDLKMALHYAGNEYSFRDYTIAQQDSYTIKEDAVGYFLHGFCNENEKIGKGIIEKNSTRNAEIKPSGAEKFVSILKTYSTLAFLPFVKEAKAEFRIEKLNNITDKNYLEKLLEILTDPTGGVNTKSLKGILLKVLILTYGGLTAKENEEFKSKFYNQKNASNDNDFDSDAFIVAIFNKFKGQLEILKKQTDPTNPKEEIARNVHKQNNNNSSIPPEDFGGPTPPR